ncbi:MAG: prepilin-type N-terminal cleavage/methylation domain-containing protein [Phycisphaera sp.]|nr:prepilin-type N-terminal cleavage/methylation domain-containing protein [Phycisphaera sp.]
MFQRGRQIGFTLIEVLVSLGIMAVLAAILLPEMSRASSVARESVCGSNLRQTHLAQTQYESDHGQWTTVWTQAEKVSWRTRLAPYVANRVGVSPVGVLRCPEDDDERRRESYNDATNDQFVNSIGLSGLMRFKKWSGISERIPNPSEIITLGDQPTDIVETLVTSDSYGTWASENYANWYGVESHDPSRGYRHTRKDGANFAMADGSVRTLLDHELTRGAGHWYWWDALVGDTAQADPDGQPSNMSMPSGANPSPTPSISGPETIPVGPLRAPCGCPLQ